MRRSLAPLLLLAGLTFLVGLGTPAMTDADEAFYAEASREMVESGDWLTPAYNYEPRFQKPVLYYWLTAVTFVVAGPGPGAARLWSALAGVGLVFVTAGLTRRWYDDDTALLAGAITGSSFGYCALGRMALPDLPLALCITATIASALVALGDRVPRPRRWVVAAAVAAALGFLTKGPLALVLPALVVGPIAAIERRTSRLRAADAAIATAVFVALAAPWYLAMWATHGSAYLSSFFVGDNLERFATTRFNDVRPWWFYLPVVLGGLAPWTPYALLGLRGLGLLVSRRAGPGSLETRLWLWVLLPLGLFTISIGKQPRYVLPLLPPLAILLAAAITDRLRTRHGYEGGVYRSPPDRGIQGASIAAGVLLILVAALLWRAQPLLVDVPPWRTFAAVGATGVGGLLVIAVACSSRWRSAPWVLACASSVALPAVMMGALAGGAVDAVERVAQSVRAERRPAEAIGVSRVFVRNLVFYTGVRQTDLINDEQLRAFLSQHGTALVVVPAEILARVEAAGAPAATRLAEFRYLNQAGLRVRSFLWPDPERDVQTVVLVRTRG